MNETNSESNVIKISYFKSRNNNWISVKLPDDNIDNKDINNNFKNDIKHIPTAHPDSYDNNTWSCMSEYGDKVMKLIEKYYPDYIIEKGA